MAATVEEGNMRCFYVRNVSEALYQVKLAIEKEGVKEFGAINPASLPSTPAGGVNNP